MPVLGQHFRHRVVWRRSFSLPLVLLLITMTFIAVPLFQANIVSAGPHNGNRTTNWSFEDSFTSYQGGEVGNNWTPFVIGQNAPSFRNTAAFNPDWVERIDGDTSQMIWANGPSFTAGLYQKINVTPGMAYRGFYCTASVGGSTRTVGIDPYGGTDPEACSVVWGTSYSANGGWATIELGTAPNVTVVAQSSQITLFVKVSSDGGMKQTWIDAVELTPDDSAPTTTPTSVGTPFNLLYSSWVTEVRRCYQDTISSPTGTPSPSITPGPTVTANPYSFQSISWEPNCGMILIKIFVSDTAGNPLDGVVLRYETADGVHTARSNPTGDPVHYYDHGWTDFSVQPDAIMAYTWRVWVVDDADNMLSSKVDVNTNMDGCGGNPGEGHQVATVRFRKN